MKSFEELDAWRRAHEMVLAVYKLSGMFPKDERFGIISQLRRAAASVPANIAEGFGRRTTRDFVRCLDIAGGSLEETRYFLRLSKDLGYRGGRIYLREGGMRRSWQVVGWAGAGSTAQAGLIFTGRWPLATVRN